MAETIDEKITELEHEPITGENPVINKGGWKIDEIKVELEPKEGEKYANARLYWDWHNKDWVAFVYGKGYLRGDNELCRFEKGPFRLNEAMCRKLLESYRFPESELTLECAGIEAQKKFMKTYKAAEGEYDIRLVSVTSPRVFRGRMKK